MKGRPQSPDRGERRDEMDVALHRDDVVGPPGGSHAQAYLGPPAARLVMLSRIR
jgi:hypothetical protein